ncbi:MAG: hypothetical protein KAH32_05785 [Chlamydiia bacterium]|nr:hypothetical protein [Chlamydiia bacterium]
MATEILYMGDSSVGKSTALRNLDSKSTFMIKPGGKTLTVPGWKTKYFPTAAAEWSSAVPKEIMDLPEGDVNKLFELPEGNLVSTSNLHALNTYFNLVDKQMPHVKTLVVEDLSHYFSAVIFSDEFLGMNKGNEAFQRWTEFGAGVYKALFSGIEDLRDDLTIIIIHHTQLKDTGIMSFKTSGKLLDDTIDPVSYFTYVLHGLIEEKDGKIQYMIQTNRDRLRFAKTPYGVFNSETEFKLKNDIVPILDRINKYEKGEIEIAFD